MLAAVSKAKDVLLCVAAEGGGLLQSQWIPTQARQLAARFQELPEWMLPSVPSVLGTMAGLVAGRSEDHPLALLVVISALIKVGYCCHAWHFCADNASDRFSQCQSTIISCLHTHAPSAGPEP